MRWREVAASRRPARRSRSGGRRARAPRARRRRRARTRRRRRRRHREQDPAQAAERVVDVGERAAELHRRAARPDASRQHAHVHAADRRVAEGLVALAARRPRAAWRRAAGAGGRREPADGERDRRRRTERPSPVAGSWARRLVGVGGAQRAPRRTVPCSPPAAWPATCPDGGRRAVEAADDITSAAARAATRRPAAAQLVAHDDEGGDRRRARRRPRRRPRRARRGAGGRSWPRRAGRSPRRARCAAGAARRPASVLRRR